MLPPWEEFRTRSYQTEIVGRANYLFSKRPSSTGPWTTPVDSWLHTSDSRTPLQSDKNQLLHKHRRKSTHKKNRLLTGIRLQVWDLLSAIAAICRVRLVIVWTTKHLCTFNRRSPFKVGLRNLRKMLKPTGFLFYVGFLRVGLSKIWFKDEIWQHLSRSSIVNVIQQG